MQTKYWLKVKKMTKLQNTEIREISSFEPCFFIKPFSNWSKHCLFLSHHGPQRKTYQTTDPLYGPYHKGEWPGWQSSVVVDAVSHTHLNLSFLNPVAGSVIQKTHYSVDGKLKGLMEKRSKKEVAFVQVNFVNFYLYFVNSVFIIFSNSCTLELSVGNS